MGSSTENSAYGPSRNPWDPTPGAGRLRRRLGGRRLRRARAVGARLRHRRVGQAAVRVLRQRRPASDLRHRLALRDRRVRVEPRPGRAGGEDGARLRLPVLGHLRSRPKRLDDRRRAGGRGADGRRAARLAHRRAAPAERGRGDRARREGGGGRGDPRTPRSSARRSTRASCRCRSTTGCPATT